MMKKNNEFAMIMEALAGINTKMDDMGKRLDVLEGKAKETKKATATETKKVSAKKATAKKSSKGTKKSTATATVEKPKTRAEAIKSRYSDEERKAYGEAAKAVREEMMAENKKKVKVVKGEKVYADDYFVGAKWKKEYAKRMKARGF